ncbi:MAG: ATP-binding protein, partial [Acidobacteriota bacterium]
LLDGLEGANVAGQAFDRTRMEQILSSLSSRVFLMNNVHEDKPVLFESRWALSYLAGPLTRAQIQRLKKPEEQISNIAQAPVTSGNRVAVETERPVLSHEIQQHFLPVRTSEPPGSNLIYIPKLWGSAKLFYADAKIGIAAEQDISVLKDFDSDWNDAEKMNSQKADLDQFPPVEGTFGELPSEGLNPKSYVTWTRSFSGWVFRTQTLKLWKSNLLDQVSRPQETEKDFRIRLQQAAHEERDRQVEKLRTKYAAKIASLQERLRRAQQTVEREKTQASQQKVQTAISFGTTVLGALFGRKKISTSVLGRATTAARGVGRSMKESEDIARAEESVSVLQKQLTALEQQLQIESQDLQNRIDPQIETFQSLEIRPKKTNITVKQVALVWVPHWKDANGNIKSAV